MLGMIGEDVDNGREKGGKGSGIWNGFTIEGELNLVQGMEFIFVELMI